MRFLLPPKTVIDASTPDIRIAETPEAVEVGTYVTTSVSSVSRFSVRYMLPADRCGDETQFFKPPGLRNTTFRVVRDKKVVYEQYYQ
jgi:hypothetical protein